MNQKATAYRQAKGRAFAILRLLKRWNRRRWPGADVRAAVALHMARRHRLTTTQTTKLLRSMHLD